MLLICFHQSPQQAQSPCPQAPSRTCYGPIPALSSLPGWCLWNFRVQYQQNSPSPAGSALPQDTAPLQPLSRAMLSLPPLVLWGLRQARTLCASHRSPSDPFPSYFLKNFQCWLLGHETIYVTFESWFLRATYRLIYSSSFSLVGIKKDPNQANASPRPGPPIQSRSLASAILLLFTLSVPLFFHSYINKLSFISS